MCIKFQVMGKGSMPRCKSAHLNPKEINKVMWDIITTRLQKIYRT
jgi:hypothetical protein